MIPAIHSQKPINVLKPLTQQTAADICMLCEGTGVVLCMHRLPAEEWEVSCPSCKGTGHSLSSK